MQDNNKSVERQDDKMRKENTKKALQEALDEIKRLCEHSTDKGHEEPYTIIGRIESISSTPYRENLYKEL